MKDASERIVWSLDCPAAEGLYWELSLKHRQPQLIRVYAGPGGALYVGRREVAGGSPVPLAAYYPPRQGLVAYCGPDLAPPPRGPALS